MSAPEPADDAAGLIAVVGATGTGKTDLAIEIALALADRGERAEIVNADAMQLYRGMDIGTAKVREHERRGIPHHLLDVLDVTQEASVAAYQVDARAAVDDVLGRGATPILVGGSGLYVSSVLFRMEFPGTDPELRASIEADLATHGPDRILARLRALDPAAADGVDARNPRRLVRALEVASRRERPVTSLPAAPQAWRTARILHLRREREALVAGLDRRAAAMFEHGLVDEVAGLVDAGLELGKTARAAIGYAQALAVLHGTSTVDDAVEGTAYATRRYARRQVSWFKRYAGAEDLDVTGARRSDLSALARRIVA